MLLGCLLLVLGSLTLLACLPQLLLDAGQPSAGLLSALARPLQLGVGDRSPGALFTQALLCRLGRFLRSGELLLPGAAPIGEFVLRPRRLRGRGAAAGARPRGLWRRAGAEVRRRGEGVDQAATGPLVGCVRIGEYGAQGRFEVLLDRLREPLPGLAGELYGLPRQSGHDTAALCGEVFETLGVQALVGLAQRLSQFEELPAFLRLGAQQEVRRPSREGGTAGRVDTACVIRPTGRFGGRDRRLSSSDEVGRRRGVQLVENGFHVELSTGSAAFARRHRPH